MTGGPLLLSVGVSDLTTDPAASPARWWDLAVDGAAPLAELLPPILLACGLAPPLCWSVLDGDRVLDPAGAGLAGQGVVCGARLVLRAAGRTAPDRVGPQW